MRATHTITAYDLPRNAATRNTSDRFLGLPHVEAPIFHTRERCCVFIGLPLRVLEKEGLHTSGNVDKFHIPQAGTDDLRCLDIYSWNVCF